MSRYHKAAIDGYLDLLKEATRKDLNSPDEDGMTPTLWAAFHGHVEALQLICSRGGDPNRSDIWGNTPLHHAATNGHMHILSFLVNFGANLFSQDNDFHTAMDVAASGDRMDCVRFLDSAASQQTIQNAKKVARLKKEATKEAETRVKLCERVKKRHKSKMDKMYQGSVSEASTASPSFSKMGTINSVNEQFSKLIASDTSGSLTARSKGTLQRIFGKKDKGTTEKVRRDGNVIFVKQENGTLSGTPEFMGVFSEQDEIDEEEDGGMRRFTDDEVNDDDEGGDGPGAKESIFKRPGLGNMVFRKNFSMEMGIEPDDFPSGNNENLGFLIRREGFDTEGEDTGFVEDEEDGNLPWNQEEIGLDDDQDEETSPLDAFLSSISLPDFSPAFTREQLDLEALMLCSDDDLKGIRIQLGPRKKILEAAARRKNALEKPGAIKDSFL
ncbi:ankyrin repeat and SAM domain-containing protein 4B-like [Salmo salar]|uniref:Ankyrin repeat and SAM domain-containing protein 4B-like n=1 Tax=Salmo salar TaxID=8030 RepID=A0A1S3RB35_SALSA|nr:ankyrin repeat and SAM domain-containing protein 4B-like [Salmo salar]|eukprot:XP_014049578.1 PREDICTED: ankyrin repeat and SAM domain-containing protein 4B-like [Salmo salar]